MGEVVALRVDFQTFGACFFCGIEWAAPYWFVQRRRESGGAFYCPSGHVQVYTKSENQQLREQAAAKEREIEDGRRRLAAECQHSERQWRARRVAEGRLAAVRQRTANGVCPCCKRTFANVARHMKTKHPKYGAPSESEGGEG